MATEAQIQANRANARKSTGPRTDAGKSRSRLNALKHGLRAREVEPVLPQEDPAELQERIRAWVDDYQPANAIERDLVTRAAKTSWALDRAERHETAQLCRRVRKALMGARAKRVARAGELGRKLLYLPGRQLVPVTRLEWVDDPAAFVAALEETPEGARWLLDRWVEVRCLIISDELWTPLDQYKFIRLLGKQPFAAVEDPDLNEIFLAWDVIDDGWGTRFWKRVQEQTPYQDPAFSAWRIWREIVPRPADAAAGVALLRGIAEREVARLTDLLEDLEAAEAEDATEIADRASFSPGAAAERLRRHQAARTRELIKLVEALAKLRKEAAKPEPRKAAAAPKPAVDPTSEPDPAPAVIVVEERVAPLNVDVAAAERTQTDPPATPRPKATAGPERGRRKPGRRAPSPVEKVAPPKLPLPPGEGSPKGRVRVVGS